MSNPKTRQSTLLEKGTKKHLVTFQNVAVAVSLLSYLFSLTQVAFERNDRGTVTDYLGYESFLMGMISFLGGGLPEWFIWLANPLFFLCLWLTIRGSKKAFIAGAVALLLSFSFNYKKEVLAAENGRTAVVTSRGTGYYTWLGSMVLITIAAGRNLLYRSRLLKDYEFDKSKE